MCLISISSPRVRIFSLCLLLLVAAAAFAPVLAEASAGGTDKEDERELLAKDLGRRSKIVLGKLGNGAAGDGSSVNLNLGLDSAGLGVFDAFFTSFSMILVSEIGDETFIIAALMAMRHPKSIVLSGALSALVVMTVLSTGLGRIVPNLISRKHTNSAATVLYAFFGLRLLYIAWRSDSKSSQKKEMEEVEEKLESGPGKTTIRRYLSRFCTPIFLESFILTFLAEWGDRSQIATITGNAQECCRSCCRGNSRAFDMHIAGSGGRKHLGIEDLAENSCYHWRPPVSGFLLVFLFLSSTVKCNLVD